ncbi:MAG: hypothetical protein JO199_08705 [Candidatus Eremiobacteraeota bacterium]|nr:hypothetical protein [Candidatus Eremiobacteraeota bacterium]
MPVQYLARLAAWWRALSATVRVTTCAGIFAGCTVAVAAFVTTHAPHTALFATPLHPEQLAEVEERLAGWNVAFVPSTDNVVVDAGARNELLLRLALAGVPHPHVETTGEALASVGALTPQAVIDAQARAGLAGDIEAGLRGIDGVDDARVIVAPAKPAEFADESSRAATASVRLRTRGGARLGHAQVAGIRAFVAAAVPGLTASNVTILDDSGAALSEAPENVDAADVQRSLQAALDAAYGDGATIVRVRAEYRDERLSQHDLRRGALGPAPIEAVTHDESYEDGAKRYRHDDRSEDRGSATQETDSETPAGSLRRMSTAVFVDRSHTAELATIRDLAAAAVGYDARRGDTLTVAAVEFHRSVPPRHDVWWLLYGTFVPLAPAVVVAIAIVVGARFAVPPFAAIVRSAAERAYAHHATKAVAGLEPARVRSALAKEPPHAAAAVISALPAATAAAVLELYPAHEREAILRRMQRPTTPLLDDAEEVLRRHA